MFNIFLLQLLFIKYNHKGLQVRKIISSYSKLLRIKEIFSLGNANKIDKVQENKQQSSASVLPQMARWGA